MKFSTKYIRSRAIYRLPACEQNLSDAVQACHALLIWPETKNQAAIEKQPAQKKEGGAKKKQTESKFVSSEFAWRPLACVVESVSPPEAKQIQPIIHTYETKECMYAPGPQHKISSYFTLVV